MRLILIYKGILEIGSRIELSRHQNNFARSENDARKAEIADLDSYAKGENEARIKDIADINARLAKENEERSGK